MKWEVVIGLETHAQLSTASKIFSGASTAFGAAPNTQACAVDIALPGVLPVLNKGAVERAIRFGLAVGGKINRYSIFARKNYFYPDLPKGYQISQYELPIVEGGSLTVMVGNTEKTVRLTRAHLEEDAGKSLHEDFQGATGIDLNRAGTPLLEIVTEPDMRSSAEAVAYAKALHALVRWIDICDGNMQEGSFRCDANVSVRLVGSDKLGTRAEIKNLNSFRFLEQAIEFEIRRQIELLEDGSKVVQETRLYDPDKGETRSMRSKEDAHDYRYFPDPDLLPLEVSQEQIDLIREKLPELPSARALRYRSENYEQYHARLRQDIKLAIYKVREGLSLLEAKINFFGLSQYDAQQLASTKEIGDYFEDVVATVGQEHAKLVANWIISDVSSYLNQKGIEITASPLSAKALASLLNRIVDGTISGKIAKEVFSAMWNGEHGRDADAIIAAKGLKQISDSGAIEKIVDEVIAANAQQVADYKAGKDKAFNSLVGQVMKATKGKANPQQVNDVLKRKLAG